MHSQSNSLFPFLLLTNLSIHPDCVDDFQAIAKKAAANTLQTPGVLRFDVLQGDDKHSHFSLAQVFENDAAYEAAQANGACKQFQQELSRLADCSQTQSLRFDVVLPLGPDTIGVPVGLRQGNDEDDSHHVHVQLTILVVDPSRAVDFEEHFVQYTLQTVEAGAARCDLYRQQKNKYRYLLIQAFTSKSAMEAHKSSRLYKSHVQELFHWLVEPRQVHLYTNTFPAAAENWTTSHWDVYPRSAHTAAKDWPSALLQTTYSAA
eukprot:jgi/Chlat1/6101/Chrsp40S05680